MPERYRFNLRRQCWDYLLAATGNQETLAKSVQQALLESVKATSLGNDVTIEQGHGRVEILEYNVLPAGELIPQFPAWKGLKSIGVAIGYRTDKVGEESLDYRYYIYSADQTLLHLETKRQHSQARCVPGS